MVGLLVVMMLAGGSQVLTSYNSKVLEREGVTAELVLDANIPQPEALANALIEAEGLTPWNAEQPTTQSRSASPLAYRARYSGSGAGIIVYYHRDHSGVVQPVCRIRRRQGGMSTAFDLARRWCATSLGVAVDDHIPAPIVTTSDRIDQLIRRLDLTSFPNSTGPRRASGKRTPEDYGFIETDRGKSGVTMTSRDGGWLMSFTVLATSVKGIDVCFRDQALQQRADRIRPSYDAMSSLRLARGADGYWSALASPINYPSCRRPGEQR